MRQGQNIGATASRQRYRPRPTAGNAFDMARDVTASFRRNPEYEEWLDERAMRGEPV